MMVTSNAYSHVSLRLYDAVKINAGSQFDIEVSSMGCRPFLFRGRSLPVSIACLDSNSRSHFSTCAELQDFSVRATIA
jgi:hypothetical protein